MGLLVLFLALVFFVGILVGAGPSAESDEGLRTYVVQLHPRGRMVRSVYPSEMERHLSLLREAAGLTYDGDPSSRLLYSYRSAMSGFAARLSEAELDALRRSKDVISVRPDVQYQLQTTYSYKFLGLETGSEGGAWMESRYGRATIIGVLDTGVWPESPSFDDHGIPPAPRRWKGTCQEGQYFNSSNCNRKLIGARFFIKGHHVASSPSSAEDVSEYVSPRDSHGHGTHTSSTAAGVSVPMASVLGLGAGVARGMAPGAHIAIYKVCWFNGCYSSDILAAMDVAIRDGVDVLSLSLGGFPIPLFADSIAIGSFRAMESGISVICAAGNNGPIPNSVANEAPWILTVGASTLDRKFPAIVQLGNGKFLYGESMFPGNRHGKALKELEVVYVTGGDRGSEYCFKGSLPREKVRGKMVVCDRGINGRTEKGQVVKEAGGAAMILANTEINREEDSVDVHILPATSIGYSESILLKAYINSTRQAKARIIFGGTVIGKNRAPEVASFSARGPSLNNPSILKPDLIAPGVNIIAAWPQNLGPSVLPEDPRRTNFSVMSGTSMACPHVSGIASIIRSSHPKWSPAAIKSAMMTTADITDRSGKAITDNGAKPAGLFATGAGQVNPTRAINPGLIYDIKPNDYITHLCTLGYQASEMLAITHRNISCKSILAKNRGFTLNYPTISVTLTAKTRQKRIKREVTNVGEPNSTYSVEVGAPEGTKVRVKPRRLVFDRINKRLRYRVWIISKGRRGNGFSEGHLSWVYQSGGISYTVRSPISVTWKHK
ncbi:hypothetical protein MLD38_029726 [Melastoma candidum]|uniref:Uncharacterized protein n=1 Tax=Melastoma candidum TaxID=119954 RepID=A0ACB9N6C8_9MYRT|nr:hypothetical protein MLD38_029726 [Melastoma candidum]